MRRRLLWIAVAAGLTVLAGIAWWAVMRSDGAILPFLRRDTTWQAIQQRGVWRVGLDPSFPPFEMLDESGKPVGYDVALAQMLADSWGVRAEIVAVGFDSLPDTLKAGRIDSIVSAYAYDERLTQDFLFSTPYFDAGLRIGVRDGSMIREMTDLSGRHVGVEWGSLGDMIGRRLQHEGMELTVAPFNTPDELIDALIESQSVDAILIDNVSLRQAQAAGAAIDAVGAPLESIPYVIIMPRRAFQLQERLEVSLQQLKSTGYLAALEEHWFSGNPKEELAP
jgi:polar amino acid transport system substrate-binding protein